MNKKTTLLKIFFAAVLTAAICFIAASLSIKKAIESDPEIFNKISNEFRLQNNLNFFQIRFDSDDSSNYEDVTANWSFPSEIEKINLQTISSKIIIQSTNEKEILIKATGQSEKSGKLLNVDANTKKLTIEQPEHVKNLQIEIFIPENFKNDLIIESVSGELNIKNIQLNNIKIETVNTNTSIENLVFSKLNAESVTGKFNLKLNPNSKDYNFNLESVAGKISNSLPSYENGKNHIHVQTVSGEININ